MNTIFRWIRYPFFRYHVQRGAWRSVWIHWGWRPIGIRRYLLEFGYHVLVSFGPFTITRSINLGKPGR